MLSGRMVIERSFRSRVVPVGLDQEVVVVQFGVAEESR